MLLPCAVDCRCDVCSQGRRGRVCTQFRVQGEASGSRVQDLELSARGVLNGLPSPRFPGSSLVFFFRRRGSRPLKVKLCKQNQHLVPNGYFGTLNPKPGIIWGVAASQVMQGWWTHGFQAEVSSTSSRNLVMYLINVSLMQLVISCNYAWPLLMVPGIDSSPTTLRKLITPFIMTLASACIWYRSQRGVPSLQSLQR